MRCYIYILTLSARGPNLDRRIFVFFFSEEIDFRRQNLTSMDVKF